MPLCGHSLRSAAAAYGAPLRHSLDADYGRIIGSHALSLARTMRREERRNDTMDIGGWLRRLGLERYEQAFRDNEIDLRVLPELTADDLKELGVAAIGHRRLLLKAIADLAAGAGRAAAEDVPAASPANATAEAERRQLTVMFCDLVGSTPLSTRFDPEDLRGIIGAYHRCVAEIVEGFGGFVARYMGDGELVCSAIHRRTRTTPRHAMRVDA